MRIKTKCYECLNDVYLEVDDDIITIMDDCGCHSDEQEQELYIQEIEDNGQLDEAIEDAEEEWMDENGQC